MQKKPIFIVFIIIAVIIMICLWLIYKSDRIMDFAIKNNLPGARTIYNELGKLEQQLNPFIAFKYNLRRLRKSDIPAFHIKLSSNDLRFFHEVEQKVREGDNYIDPELKTWRNAEMTYNNKKYDIKIRIHGIYKTHAECYKKSYQIKILNNENINGLSTLNFILPEDRFYYFATLANYLADKLQAPALDSDFVNLFFNGYIQGIYFFTEDPNKEFLEHHGFQSSSLFNTNDDLLFTQLSVESRNELLQGYINKQGDSYSLKFKDAQYFLEFLQALKEKNLSRIYEMIDVEETAKFAAIATLYQDRHMDNVNIKYYLDTTTGKITPIIWDIQLWEIIKPDIGFDAQFLNTRGSLNEIVSLFLLNPQFLQLRNKYLYQLVNTDLVVDYINEASNKLNPLFMMDTNNIYSYRRTKWFLDGYKKIIQNNVNFFRDILELNEIYITSHYNTDYVDVDIGVYNLSQVQLNAIKFDNVIRVKPNAKIIINHLNGKQDIIPINQSESSFTVSLNSVLMYPYLDESFTIKHPKLTLNIIGMEFGELSVDNIKLEMTNDVSSISVDAEKIRYEATAYYSKATTLDEKNLRKNGIRYSLQNNHLVIYPGTYLFNETYKIPEDFRVTIKQGTTLLLGAGVSLIFKNSLSIDGSAMSPVFIKNLVQGKPFGSVAVIGNADVNVSISFLNLSRGSEDYVDGAYISGALSVYHTNKTVIKNSIFLGSSSDDGINIKYSKVFLENNIFKDNYSDQLDFDFCQGIVSNNQFIGPIKKYGDGDGADISGSKILFEKNIFSDMGDKGISIGEKSEAYIIDSTMARNHMGSAVKDNSIAYFYNNQWIDNESNLEAYQKKAIFGGGTIVLDKDLSIKGSDVKLDSKSEIRTEAISEKIKEIYDKFLPYR